MKIKHNKVIDFFFKSVKKRYLKNNPLNAKIKDELKKNLVDYQSRINAINDIRVNNITTTLWSNTGTLFGIIITYVSLLLTLFFAIIPFGKLESLQILGYKFGHEVYFFIFFSFIFVVIIIYKLVAITTPIIIKYIIFHLPPREYAEITFSNLNQSEILSFTSLKMWELCELFTDTIKINNTLKNLLVLNNEGTLVVKDDLYKNHRDENLSSIILLSKSIKTLDKIYHKFHYNALEIRDLSTKKLKIQEREFCHHILKFSPTILHSRLSTLKLSVDTLQYILESNAKFDKEEFILVFQNHLKEVFRVYNDVLDNRMTSLMQLIIFEDIHKYIIGISSVTSTSRSMKIFLRGLSTTIEKLPSNQNQLQKSKFKNQVKGEFKSLLHRSKAHYGMDLLISVENLYKKKVNKLNEKQTKIPEILYHLKYPKGISGVGKSSLFSNYTFDDLVTEYQFELRNMRNDLLNFYKEDIELIKNNFNVFLSQFLNKNGKKYFCIFGYSRIVRNVLKSFAEILTRDDVGIFIFKQNGHQMIDTRIMRFELNDDKPINNIRSTFTSSDDFFLSLIQKEDNVTFIAGAEAFCNKTGLLLHTNSYQRRVNKLIECLESDENKPIPDIWILANDYKVFDGFPPKDYLFRKEFLSDHYDEVDLYNFSNIQGKLELISN